MRFRFDHMTDEEAAFVAIGQAIARRIADMQLNDLTSHELEIILDTLSRWMSVSDQQLLGRYSCVELNPPTGPLRSLDIIAALQDALSDEFE